MKTLVKYGVPILVAPLALVFFLIYIAWIMAEDFSYQIAEWLDEE